MRPLFIIGYMGCGKTTFGKALSTATGISFIDLDFYIEQRFHASIREIFDKHGEDGFRKIEREMLQEVSQFENTIISCGGGTPCFFDNMDIMNENGTTLWLQASQESLFSRLIRKREKRPLLAGHTDEEIREIISSQLKKREPFYSKAKIIWKGDSLEDRRQIDDNIADFLSTHSLEEM